MAFTVVAIIVSFFILDVQENMTDTVAVRLQNDTKKPKTKV
jgi:hypothetical protein